ncbi:cell wall hydrolase [Halanaerobium salsuginis]|jgi:N-acetylmuramoyl-L-alanine amidase|uniref:N-acetylmuramoyl-L-alanine amidase n=1 Tax=Halanaerobium salsuginis TaxID=29563 RepID=A0A1I4EQN8_9FIRM|nr:cell wall hydrolase [Halanaerobium salsuginis]SFL08055.1 N-acetylmuramoyl-L-alanine amidase [Halanaerobium salsuginis]
MLSRAKILASVMLLLLMISFVSLEKVEALDMYEFGTRVIRQGEEGIDVAVLQHKLKKIGYYQGHVDGLYGKGTVAAVKKFQQANGLQVDGVFGKSSFAVLPKLNVELEYNISRDDILLLARVINGEARGEDFKGKVAVGSVILNRIKDNKFPNTIRGVILQKGQFSSLMDGQANYYPGEEELQAARAALLGYDPTRGSIYFYNPDVATNTGWVSRQSYVTRIGGHVFMR